MSYLTPRARVILSHMHVNYAPLQRSGGGYIALHMLVSPFAVTTHLVRSITKELIAQGFLTWYGVWSWLVDDPYQIWGF